MIAFLYINFINLRKFKFLLLIYLLFNMVFMIGLSSIQLVELKQMNMCLKKAGHLVIKHNYC